MSSATSAGWHSIDSIFRCEKEYELSQVYKVREPQSKIPDHFAIGLLLHAAKAAWFASNFKATPGDIRKAMEVEQQSWELPCDPKAWVFSLNLVKQYIENWQDLPYPTVIAAEYDLGPTSLTYSNQDTAPEYTKRTARLDDVSYYPEGGDKLWIGESKTTSGSINDVVQEYEQHGQPLLQFALWKVDPRGEAKHGKVAGVMLDVIKKGYGGKPCEFGRIPVVITDFQQKWYVGEFIKKARLAHEIKQGRSGDRNIAGCTRMAGRMRIDCTYKSLCKHGGKAGLKYIYGNEAKPLGEFQGSAPWEI